MFEPIEFRSSNGTDTVHAYILPTAAARPRGIVQIVHGMCEYIGRYEPFMQLLAENGYIVCGHDHIGHGASAGENGLGYFAPRDGWDCLVRDTRQLTILMRGRYPTLPVYLFGHSMGSFVAREYMARYRDLAGVLLSGTGGANPLAGVGRGLIQAISRAKGDRYRSSLVNSLAFGGFNRAFPEAATQHDWLTRDAAEVAKYEADPLCTFVFTVSAYGDLMELITRVSGKKWARRVPAELPIFLYSGDCDPVGGMGKGVGQVAGWLAAAGVRHVKFKLYKGGRHEMHNEINRDEVFRDVLHFLDRAARLNRQQGN